MAVYKNVLTGEYHCDKSKIQAWLFFFYEAERKGIEKPEMQDIIKIKIDKRVIALKKIIENTKDIDSEFVDIVNKNFWELI